MATAFEIEGWDAGIAHAVMWQYAIALAVNGDSLSFFRMVVSCLSALLFCQSAISKAYKGLLHASFRFRPKRKLLGSAFDKLSARMALCTMGRC